MASSQALNLFSQHRGCFLASPDGNDLGERRDAVISGNGRMIQWSLLIGERGFTNGRMLALDQMDCACSQVTGYYLALDAGRSVNLVLEHV